MTYKTKEIRELLKEFQERYSHVNHFESKINWEDVQNEALSEFGVRLKAIGGYQIAVVAMGYGKRYSFGDKRIVYGKTKSGFYNYISLHYINSGWFSREERSTDTIYRVFSESDAKELKDAVTKADEISKKLIAKYQIYD